MDNDPQYEKQDTSREEQVLLPYPYPQNPWWTAGSVDSAEWNFLYADWNGEISELEDNWVCIQFVTTHLRIKC